MTAVNTKGYNHTYK